MLPRSRCWMMASRVSIRTRHFCRVMHLSMYNDTIKETVSIRTRHFCRVMLSAHAVIKRCQLVSIRTRHFCRVMPGSAMPAKLSDMFQSAPGISAG